jgi:SAM-dependent methyltransferase
MDIDGLLFSTPNSAELSAAVGDPKFIRDIAPDDNMHKGDNDTYYWVGLTGMDCINAVTKLANKTTLRSILDLPCGFGRVTRFIKSAYPDSHLTACDIDRDGVDFCARVFGATPVYSSETIEEVQMPGRFDLIWVGSLFTHLDHEGWLKLIKYLSNLLEKDGLLIFTVAGQFVYNLALTGKYPGVKPEEYDGIRSDFESSGFSHSKYKPLTVKEENYGRTFVSREWVSARIRDLGNLREIAYISRGYGRRQDVFACQKL